MQDPANQAPPPGWPVTDRPMRVAFLGWARLSLQAREGSGYNLSASELAAGLAMSGHAVFYLASGMRFSPVPGPRIRPREAWRGVRCFDLINSPNCSPAAVNFGNMRREIESPRASAAVLRWLDANRIEIVHIHSLEGYSLDLVRRIRASGRPVIVTPHNYWFVCPQVDLLHEEVRVCTDYEGGRRCAGCLKSKPYAAQRLVRTVGQTLEATVGTHVADAVRKAAYGSAEGLRGMLSRPRAATLPATPRPDPESALGFDVEADGHPGTIEHHLTLVAREAPKEPGRAPLDQNERFLSPESRTRHLAVLDTNVYARRRRAGVEALNAASLVTPPSEFLRRAHVAMGVEESRTRVVRLGQPHFDQLHRRARRSPFYRTRPWDPRTANRPLRFAFFGVTRANKGLEVLVRAIPLLDRDVRQRCQFLIRAGGWDWPFRQRLAPYPEVQFAGGYDLLQLIGAGGEYDVGVLPHIWFENSPLVLLEHLHAGKFVIASRLGGPPEWIVEPSGPPSDAEPRYNGLLFPAGHPEPLAGAIARLVRGGVVIPSPAEVHAATPNLQSYPGHVGEVEGLYRSVLG